MIGAGLIAFALRGWRLTVESNYGVKSRETLLVINNIVILVATLVVLLGTLYPIIADSFNLGQVSVGPPYFNALFVPLTWLILLTMGMGSNMRWKQDKRPLLGISLTILVSSALLAAIVTYLFTQSLNLQIIVTSLLCLWVLGWIIYDVKDKTKNAATFGQGIKRLKAHYWGMQIAHIGLLIVAMGVGVTSALSVEKDVAMTVGDTVKINHYDFTLVEFDEVRGKNYDATQAEIKVEKDGKFVTTLYPQKRNYVVSRMPMTEAGIQTTFFRDLYVALGEPIDDNDPKGNWAVRIYVKPMIAWLWLGAIIMALGAVTSMLDRRYRLNKS